MDPLTPEQLSGYLFRVKLSILTVPVKPDLHTLCRIHLAHVQHIPYENLSLHLDKAKQQFPVISIQTDSLFRKIVQHGRGGYCFEQNLLFAAALKACGFSIYLLQIRTLKGPAIPVPDALRVHMAVGVVLDGVHWHCDVGYGGKGLRLPIRNDLVQTSKDGKFASVSNKEDKSFTESTLCSELYKDVQDVWQAAHGTCSGYGHRLRTKTTTENTTENKTLQMQLPGLFMQALDSKGCFQDLYFFHLQETKFPEFLLLNWYTSTCPLASHLNNVVVAMQTPEGRHTYDGKEFKVFKGTKLGWSKRPESEEEVHFHLKQLFDLSFDAA